MEILYKMKEYAKQERIAINCEGEELTYRELDKLSDEVASYFIKKYPNDKSPIIICGNKENLILVLMMGALKSGRAYIPLDVTFPVERVKQVIKEVNPKIVINLTDRDLEVPNVYTKENIEDIIAKYSGNKVSEDNWVSGDDNCYILFTSGSTGKPKGVQISKNNLDSFTKWFTEYLKVGNENTAILNQPSYSFDLSVMPLYLGLLNGKKLFSLSKKTLENMRETFDELKKSDMRLWISTPAFASLCMQDDSFRKELMPNLETMYFIGEVLPPKTVALLRERFPNVRIINSYGPTEATVAITAIDITDEILEGNKELPIGYPMDGSIIIVVDDNGKEVQDEEKGEIVILGKSVSKGYYLNDEMTKKVFFDREIEGVMYRGYKSGDMGYYKENILYFCGRKDFQIKLNGFRIELEDIENNLRKVTNIKNTVVLPVNKEGKISHLVAFVILEKENTLSNLKNTLIIKEELKKYLPTYMIPRNMKIMKEFPVNSNDKVDRKKLMEEIK
ncbi:D-alanine--poly(phosphoribitol) ligase subunit DltA [Clostridium gasigenes]|uniref:D-alanine--poly(phosphoribitol) ligase subunit DltA n=1 Tax=Clostridium gasigenes TaxID=94869 RepID=UPI00143827CB|nr:D-alanine--poly(phosphoribitol) ligase subunit DltA [Clostridium gasigenes]NKF08490.1 D-alanine--poly(phosphoribitol) ligase subunit DltA [Clostridium gasigenes]QSW21304.1 D-alanine--poly(phosphoribitol) ligase subunit DltA [Clostridium gasigenes]